MSTLNASLMAGSLKPALIAANRAVSRRSTLPVLGGILVETDDACLRLTATDLSTRITTYAPARIYADGGIVIPAAAFLAFVKRTPKDARIDIAAGETVDTAGGWQKVTLSSVAGSVTLQGWEPREYPTAPVLPKKPVATIAMSAGDLDRALRSVLFSAGTGDARPILTGVYLSPRGSTLILATADNYRMSEYVIPTLYGGSKGEVVAVIPADALETWLRLSPLPGDDPTTLTILSATLAKLEYSGDAMRTTMLTRLIDGSYPNYRAVMPLAFAGSAIVDRDALVTAARAAGTRPRYGSKVASMTITSDAVTIEGKDGDGGEYRTVIPTSYDGETVTIGLDPTLLVGLANAPGSEVAIKPNVASNAALSPITFTCPAAPAWRHVMMPVRL